MVDERTLAVHVGGTSVGFDLGSYDRTRTLTIDPLLYSTLFGSTGSENGNAVAIDSMDNAYIAGFTSGGTGGDLPVTPGAYQLSNAGSGDGFVAKFNPNASGAASRLRCFVEANPL